MPRAFLIATASFDPLAAPTVTIRQILRHRAGPERGGRNNV